MKALLSAVMIGLAACCMAGVPAPPGASYKADANSKVVQPDLRAAEVNVYSSEDFFVQSTVGHPPCERHHVAFINPTRLAAVLPSFCGTVLRQQNAHPDTAAPTSVSVGFSHYAAYTASAWQMPADDDPGLIARVVHWNDNRIVVT